MKEVKKLLELSFSDRANLSWSETFIPAMSWISAMSISDFNDL
jgi:hypothetical protein